MTPDFRVERSWKPAMRGKIAAAVFGFLGLVALAGYLFLFPPFPLPPEIGRGLPSNLEQARREFERRVATRIAVPISEAELVARLKDQGFSVKQGYGEAIFEKWRFPCRLAWRVSWESRNGTVDRIAGRYGATCL